MLALTSRSEPARILVVEDEQIVALELKDRLLRAGHEVPAVAGSAEEALEAAEQLRPDLVMMDIKLQGETDGIAAAEILRRRFDVPVIYLTAFADSHTIERAKGTDPYGYILKPFHERELQVAVEIALDRHQVARRQRFLADAGREVASSLDREVLLARLTQLVVGRLSDWCVVHLQDDEDGPLRLHTFAHARASMSSLASRVLSTVVPRGRDTCVERALAGASTRERAVGDPSWVSQLLGLEPAQISAAGLGACSFVCVPLFTRGRSLGALTLVAEHPGRRFTESDLLLMEELGRLAGAGIENARLYALAQRAIRLREDVLAIVSHDLRTPLSAIGLQVGALLEPGGLSSAEEARKGARAIERNVDRMRRLVDDLLDFAHIDSGHLTLRTAPHRAGELVAGAAALFEAPAGERGARIVVEDVAEGASVLCDLERILSVFYNLVGNAIERGPEGSAVRVGAVKTGQDVRFHVSDQAGGVAPDEVAHIFEQYWRAPQPAQRLCLGLYISKGLVEAHGGAMWVEAHGAGSTFYFTLPSAPDVEAAS